MFGLFGGGTTNPYDGIVTKTTDENLTSENWVLILNLCDKVVNEGESGARNIIAAILKRLTHRNPNVQLYALSLAASLSKNCGVKMDREIASKAFTKGLEKLITDRKTHDKVKKRALALISMWTSDFENDTNLGLIEDCYNTLKGKGFKFDTPQEPLPPTVDDEIRRKEEEELQRVLELSKQDKGGRGQWSQYSLAASSVSSSSPSPAQHADTSSSTKRSLATTGTTTRSTPATATSKCIITCVRALYTFKHTAPGQLSFDKGDIIRVVDRGHPDWWRGQLKGQTGIFPVNHVEPMSEPRAVDMAMETEQEAAAFSQAVNIEKLLSVLRNFDSQAGNLTDNEEIQELYMSCIASRPNIVRLIDKYSQKRADLVSINEKFIRAQAIFDRTREETLAGHTASSTPDFILLFAGAASQYLFGSIGAAIAYTLIRIIGRRAHPLNNTTYLAMLCIVVTTISMVVMKTSIIVPSKWPGAELFAGMISQTLVRMGGCLVSVAAQHPQHDPDVGVPYSTPTVPPTMVIGTAHTNSALHYLSGVLMAVIVYTLSKLLPSLTVRILRFPWDWVGVCALIWIIGKCVHPLQNTTFFAILCIAAIAISPFKVSGAGLLLLVGMTSQLFMMIGYRREAIGRASVGLYTGMIFVLKVMFRTVPGVFLVSALYIAVTV